MFVENELYSFLFLSFVYLFLHLPVGFLQGPDGQPEVALSFIMTFTHVSAKAALLPSAKNVRLWSSNMGSPQPVSTAML